MIVFVKHKDERCWEELLDIEEVSISLEGDRQLDLSEVDKATLQVVLLNQIRLNLLSF